MNQQAILCYLDFTGLTENLSRWVSHIHQCYEKPVDLLFVRDHNTALVMGKDDNDAAIEKAMDDFRNNSGATKGKNYIREGCNCSIISQLAEQTDALFTLIPVHKRRDVQFLSSTVLLKMLRKSRIPALVIPETNRFETPQKISMAVNYRKEQKAVTPWLVHLSKMLQLDVDIYLPQSKEESIRRNYVFTKNFCKKHNISFNKIQASVKPMAIDKFAIRNTHIHCLHLSRQPGFIDRIFGDRDSYMLSGKQGTPVFCVNPGEDLYVPCT
ncbi:MAG: hypothetical protein ACLFM1_04860 [Bacteroidales bacterium]